MSNPKITNEPDNPDEQFEHEEREVSGWFALAEANRRQSLRAGQLTPTTVPPGETVEDFFAREASTPDPEDS